MKTILGFAALTAFVGLLPFSVADSKPARPQGAAVSTDASSPQSAKEAKERPARSASRNTRGKSNAEARPEERPLTTAQENKLLALLNEGSLEELDAIPGIARTRADSIVNARPFSGVEQIALVDGIGEATYGKILAYGKGLATRRAGAASAKSRKS